MNHEHMMLEKHRKKWVLFKLIVLVDIGKSPTLDFKEKNHCDLDYNNRILWGRQVEQSSLVDFSQAAQNLRNWAFVPHKILTPYAESSLLLLFYKGQFLSSKSCAACVILIFSFDGCFSLSYRNVFH